MSKKSSAGQTRPAHHNQKIGPYRLRGLLGRGGMADVYLAQGGDDREVALKVLKPEHVEDERYVQRFEREMEILEHLDSPFIAGLIGADLEHRPPWIATEFVAGPTLRSHLEQSGPLSTSEIRSLGLCLLEGLDELHERGVFHRDLTPQNVILTESGPRIVDFGISHLREATTITTHKNQFHTPGFGAPELLRGEEVTGAADLYSLGALLLAASLPNSADSLQSNETQTVDPENFRNAPSDLRSVLLPCLEDEPTERPSIPTLRQALEGLGGSPRSSAEGDAYGWQLTPEIPETSRLRRNPRSLVLAGMVLAAVGGAALSTVWESDVSEVERSLEFDELPTSTDIYAVGLTEAVQVDSACTATDFHFVNQSQEQGIEGIYWPVVAEVPDLSAFASTEIGPGETAIESLSRCASAESSGSEELGGDGLNEEIQLLILMSDGTVRRSCAGYDCAVDLPFGSGQLSYDNFITYQSRIPLITAATNNCSRRLMTPTDESVAFQNADPAMGIMVGLYKSLRIGDDVGFEYQSGSDISPQMWRTPPDWRIDSWAAQTEDFSCSQPDPLPGRGEQLTERGEQLVERCAAGEQSACVGILHLQAVQEEPSASLWNCSAVLLQCELPDGYHAPAAPLLAPSDADLAAIFSDCERIGGAACDWLWLLAGGDRDGPYLEAAASCGGRVAFRAFVCAEVGSELLTQIEPVAEYKLMAETWERRTLLDRPIYNDPDPDFDPNPEPGIFFTPLVPVWTPAECGLAAPLMINEDLNWAGASFNERGHFFAEWQRSFAYSSEASDELAEEYETDEETEIEYVERTRLTIVPSQGQVGLADLLATEEFEEPASEIRLLRAAGDELDAPLPEGVDAFIAGSSGTILHQGCAYIFDIDGTGPVDPSEAERSILKSLGSFRLVSSSAQAAAPSREAFEAAQTACVDLGRLNGYLIINLSEVLDNPALAAAEVSSVLSGAVSRAKHAASLEAVWESLAWAIETLQIAFDGGELTLSAPWEVRIFEDLGRGCGATGVDSFVGDVELGIFNLILQAVQPV